MIKTIFLGPWEESNEIYCYSNGSYYKGHLREILYPKQITANGITTSFCAPKIFIDRFDKLFVEKPSEDFEWYIEPQSRSLNDIKNEFDNTLLKFGYGNDTKVKFISMEEFQKLAVLL